MSQVRVDYYTDPACPWSWAIEPAVRRLEVEFGDGVRFTYLMGGLAREFGAPERQVADWLDAAAGQRSDTRPGAVVGSRGRE